MSDRNPFAFDDFFTQDYEAEVENVEFVVNDYDRLQAVFTNRYDEPVLGDDGVLRPNRIEYYNIGGSNLWEPILEGSAFQHTSGDPDKRIRSDSGYGKLLVRAASLMGQQALLEKGDKDLPNYGLYSSKIWIGERFHWVTEGAGEPWENKRAGTSGISRGSQMPVEWNGVGAPSQSQLAVYDVASLGLDATTLDDLTLYAKGMPLGEFQSKGISIARDLQDTVLRSKVNAALGDASFYETLRAS